MVQSLELQEPLPLLPPSEDDPLSDEQESQLPDAPAPPLSPPLPAHELVSGGTYVPE